MAKGTVKLVHSVAPSEQLSRHEQQLRKRIRDYILTTATNEGTEIDEEQVQCRIYLEESRGRTYTIPKTETDIIIHHLLECALEPGAIARRDKITTKVANIYRTYRETKEMFEDDEQDVPALATRLSGLLDAFKNRAGAWDAMAEHGLYPEDDGEGVEEAL
ncbi:hypothetical protein BDD12DRAFT_876817 [Trichophaea hybrida]|nr:hypothetical protein BDD12DRAFT_876817 [Trichophaea hybrida]